MFHQQLTKILFISVFLLSTTGCENKIQFFKKEQNKTKDTKQNTKKNKAFIITPSDTVKLETKQLDNFLSVTGELKPIKEAIISSEVEGIGLRVLKEEGDFVQKGALLAVLDDRDLQNQVINAKEILQKAIAKSDLAKITFNRKTAAYKEDLISKQEVDFAQTDYIISQKEIESAKVQLNLAQNALKRANITAPFSGIISNKLLKTGELAQRGKALFEIVQINPLKAELFIPSKYSEQMSLGLPITLSINDKSVSGFITKINPVVDDTTRSLRVTAEISNPNNLLKANMFIDGKIQLGQKRKTIILPEEALYKVETEDNKFFVFVLNESKTEATKKLIKAEKLNGMEYEVLEGVKEGEIIIKVPINTTSNHINIRLLAK